nr:PWWP domain-containing protein 2A isoform X4 [Macaca fascicularis]
MQLQSNTFQEGTEVKCEANGAVPDDPSPVPHPELSLAESLWTSKPPPLFHEGAPYPPPLFIRDTYNQSIPQPPPRKIKRPKRKMYREEPTSIMNAIKLRPRQVLCDKCKNSVVAEKKEIRKGSSASDSSKYEDKKRRNESVTTVNKKLKTDHKVDGKNQNESQKRNAVVKVSNIAHSRGRVVKVSAQANTSKAQLSTKKVLQSKNMDHVKAREVLKIAKEKAQKKQNETSTSKNAHSKVHFTRRYQNPSSGSLPPRVRLKPQRYRNEENDSSLKTGLEKMRSGKMAPKPQSRCTSTRSAGLLPVEGTQWLHSKIHQHVPAEATLPTCGFQPAPEHARGRPGTRLRGSAGSPMALLKLSQHHTPVENSPSPAPPPPQASASSANILQLPAPPPLLLLHRGLPALPTSSSSQPLLRSSSSTGVCQLCQHPPAPSPIFPCRCFPQ